VEETPLLGRVGVKSLNFLRNLKGKNKTYFVRFGGIKKKRDILFEINNKGVGARDGN